MAMLKGSADFGALPRLAAASRGPLGVLLLLLLLLLR
jgi:hypothetical protein